MEKGILLFCLSALAQISIAQNYLPLTGGTLTGILSGTTIRLDGNLSISSSVDSRIYLSNTTAMTGKNWNVISNTDGSFLIGIYGSNVQNDMEAYKQCRDMAQFCGHFLCRHVFLHSFPGWKLTSHEAKSSH